jgi:hypothetical protein
MLFVPLYMPTWPDDMVIWHVGIIRILLQSNISCRKIGYDEKLFLILVCFCDTWHASEHRAPRQCAMCWLMQVKAPTARKPQPALNVTNESLGTSQKTMLCYCLAVLHTNLVCTTNLTPLWAQVWIKVFASGTRTGFIVILRAPQNEGTQFILETIHCNFASVFAPPPSWTNSLIKIAI